MIHICLTASAAGSLKYAIREGLIAGSKVVAFTDDLSGGPIDHLCQNETRSLWWQNLYHEEYDEMTQMFIKDAAALKAVIDTADHEAVCIWYGENGCEMCGLLHVLSLMTFRPGRISTLNVSEGAIAWPDREPFKPRWVGEIALENLGNFMTYERPLSEEDYETYRAHWTKLSSEGGSLRIFDGAKLLTVPDTYFDDLILRYVRTDFKKCARVVGEVLGYSQTPVTDSFVFWRVLELIKLGQLSYRGTLGIMRMMELKKASI